MVNRKGRIATIIPARNEEKFIGQTLNALLNQDIDNNHIIVVNDGSEDQTKEVVNSFHNIELINIENRGFNAQGSPILAMVINLGLKKLLLQTQVSYDYIMILGSDHILPSHYISKIVDHMANNKDIAICSGQISGEKSIFPRGSGRLVNTEFWKQIGLQYPLNFGFEAYLLIKAQQLGYKIDILNDLVSYTIRPTRTSYKKETYIAYGKSLRALGYDQLYAAARIGLISLKNPKGAFYMLKGYTSNDTKLYENDVRNFLKRIQRERIKKYLLMRSQN
ncbi:MAG TPA: glycosyltransferase family A protein [Nitrososphaeraceae archaeon]|nr:glycosyltransferase family A protein [Nitrososphaeraceae archaeon]